MLDKKPRSIEVKFHCGHVEPVPAEELSNLDNDYCSACIEFYVEQEQQLPLPLED